MPNLGVIGSNTIFCEISLVTIPQAPISATPEDIEIKKQSARGRGLMDLLSSRWLDIGQVLFCVVTDREEKKRGQCQAILTKKARS